MSGTPVTNLSIGEAHLSEANDFAKRDIPLMDPQSIVDLYSNVSFDFTADVPTSFERRTW